MFGKDAESLEKKMEKAVNDLKTNLISKGLTDEQVAILATEPIGGQMVFQLKLMSDLVLDQVICITLEEKLSPEELSLFLAVTYYDINMSYIPVLKKYKLTGEMVESIRKTHIGKCVKNPDDLDTLLKAATGESWEAIAKVLNSGPVKRAIIEGKCDITVLDTLSNKVFSEAQIKILNLYHVKCDYKNINSMLETVSKYELTHDQLQIFQGDRIKILLFNKPSELKAALDMVSKYTLSKEQIETFNGCPTTNDVAKLEQDMFNLEKYGYVDKPWLAPVWELCGYYQDSPLVTDASKADGLNGDV